MITTKNVNAENLFPSCGNIHCVHVYIYIYGINNELYKSHCTNCHNHILKCGLKFSVEVSCRVMCFQLLDSTI